MSPGVSSSGSYDKDSGEPCHVGKAGIGPNECMPKLTYV